MRETAPAIDPLERASMTLDDLYHDFASRDCDAAQATLGAMPTDVMLSEGAGALVDAAAYLRFVAGEHARPGSEPARRMNELAETLIDQAAVMQGAADSASIAIRGANGTDDSTD